MATTIAQFREFLQLCDKRRKEEDQKKIEMGKELLSSYFSEEIEIMNSIEDMAKEWEDEGVDITYDVYINPIGRICSQVATINFVDQIINFTNMDDLESYRMSFWETRGYEMNIYIMMDTDDMKLHKICKNSLSKRIKSAYSHLDIQVGVNIGITIVKD